MRLSSQDTNLVPTKTMLETLPAIIKKVFGNIAEVDLESNKSELFWVLKANMPKTQQNNNITKNDYFVTKHSNKKAKGETSNVNYKMHQFLSNEEAKSTDNSVYQWTFNVMVSAAELSWKEKTTTRFSFSVRKLEWKVVTFIYSISGEGDGTPLQYSCLENPMDGGGW